MPWGDSRGCAQRLLSGLVREEGHGQPAPCPRPRAHVCVVLPGLCSRADTVTSTLPRPSLHLAPIWEHSGPNTGTDTGAALAVAASGTLGIRGTPCPRASCCHCRHSSWGASWSWARCAQTQGRNWVPPAWPHSFSGKASQPVYSARPQRCCWQGCLVQGMSWTPSNCQTGQDAEP